MTLYGVEWTFTVGDYRFEIGFDSGNECGLDQRDVYVSRRVPIQSVDLALFTGSRLLAAYRGPDGEERRRAFDDEVAQARARAQEPHATPHAQHASANAKSGAKRLRREAHRRERQAVRQVEAALAQQLSALPRECFDLDQLAAGVARFEDPRPLRTFYFEEVNESHMRNFGRKYATDGAYRAQVDAGETSWAARNALFVRNLTALHQDPNRAKVSSHQWQATTVELWRWMGQHAATITALPEYLHLQQIDSIQAPSATELDPEVRAAVAAWNLVPGVETRFSCQGVSGVVTFGGRRIVVPSHHEALAYIQFAHLEEPVASVVVDFASGFLAVRILWAYEARSIFRLLSAGSAENVRFRLESERLAHEVRQRMLADP